MRKGDKRQQQRDAHKNPRFMDGDTVNEARKQTANHDAGHQADTDAPNCQLQPFADDQQNHPAWPSGPGRCAPRFRASAGSQN